MDFLVILSSGLYLDFRIGNGMFSLKVSDDSGQLVMGL